MNPAARYFVRLEDGVTGPSSVAELRALAERGAITPETEVAPTEKGPWSLLLTVPEKTEIFGRPLGFAAPAFAATADGDRPVHVRDMLAAAATPGPALRAPLPAPAPSLSPAGLNEVQEMVRAVEAREAAFAPPPPPPPKRKLPRRLKFVLALAALGNVALLAIAIGYDAFGHAMSIALLGTWWILYNAGVAILYLYLPKEG